MAISIQTVLPVGMLMNATVATVFLVLTIVFLIMSHDSADSWQYRFSTMFAFIFAVLAVSTALAIRGM